jgi:ATP-dependent Clp protease protease subunit
MQAINDMMERDKYLTAEEAKEHGIIDEILHRREKGDDKAVAGDGKVKL